MAVLSVSCRSIFSRISWLPAAATREVVQRPVERCVRELKGVLVQEILLDGQQFRTDEGDDRAFDGAAVGKSRRGGAGIRGYEVFITPRKDCADAHLVVLAIDADALGPRRALVCDLGQLRLEPLGSERFGSKALSAHSASTEREVEARVVKVRQDVLLDLIQRQRAAADAVGEPLEGTRDLPDALRRVLLRARLNRI